MGARVDELVDRFGPRLSPEGMAEAQALSRALVERHPHETADALAARFVARAGALLSSAPRWIDELDGPTAVLSIEHRLRGAEARRAPPEIVDGLPVAWSAESVDRSTVLAWWARWQAERPPGQPLFVYVHVPFCRTRCTFCQFASVVERGSHGAYLRALLEDARAFAGALGPLDVDALTVGGGTPSSLTEHELDAVLRAVMGPLARLRPDDYVSVELNPDSASEGKLRVLASHGVNRVSLGVQSMHAPTLSAVARGYQTAIMVRDAVQAARRVGGLQVSLDLLAPLPLETLASFADGARAVLDLAPDQLVVYRYQPVRRGRDRTIAPGGMPWDEARALALEEALARGYRQVANTGSSLVVERPDARAYRLRYVQHPRVPTALLGLGPFAQAHVPGVARYVAEEDGRYRGEEVSPAFEEAAFVGRHLGAELPLDDDVFRANFGRSLAEAFPDALAFLEEAGELARQGKLYRSSFRERDDAARRMWLFLDAASVRRLYGASTDRTADAARRLVLRADGPPLVGRIATLVLDDVITEPRLTEHLAEHAVGAPGAALAIVARLLAHGAADEPRALTLEGERSIVVRMRASAPTAVRRLASAFGSPEAILPSAASAPRVERIELGGPSGLALAFRLERSKSALLARVRDALPPAVGAWLEAALVRYVRDAGGEGLLELDGVATDEARAALPRLRWSDEGARRCIVRIPLVGARPRLGGAEVELCVGAPRLAVVR